MQGTYSCFETKSGMYKFSQKCTKGLKNVQNLDARLLWFLRQRCAYFAIFETQLRINGEFDHQKDSAIFGIHNTSQIKVRIFSLPRSPIFNLRWFECLKIPVTMFTEERLNFFSLLDPPIFTSDDLNVWNSSNNGAELACFEPISLVFFFLMKPNVH